MTKRIFRSVFLASCLVLLAALTLVMGVLHRHFTQIQLEQLRVETALASHAVTNEGIRYFDQLDDTMDCRITWTGTDGTVLYDNRTSSDSMVNHLQRQEIRMALETGYGHSARYSDTLLEQYLYAAERLPDGTVLRLSTARSTVFQLMLRMTWSICLTVTSAVLMSYSLARHLSRSIVSPLNNLDLNDPLSNRQYDELTPLLRRISSQQIQLLQQSRELQQKQKEFTAVTRSLSEGLVLISGSGSVLSINPAAAALLNVTPNCIGADFSVVCNNADISVLVEKSLIGIKSEANISLSSGTFLASASPVRSGDSLSGVVLLLFDVTQKQKAEQLRREFTANVSHEMKTPLHAISGYAELMKSGIVPPEDMKFFSETIYNEARRMIRLVEDTLRLSRLDEGALDLQWCQVDLYAAAHTAMQMLAQTAKDLQVSLILEGTSVSVPAIPQLVSSIFFNLTENAIKYNVPGGTVRLRLEEQEACILLTVSDTGIGISDAHRERIFERFYRVDKSHSREVGGTGLGLSIVKHACSVLRAALFLESTPGEGTTVTVEFQK